MNKNRLLINKPFFFFFLMHLLFLTESGGNSDLIGGNWKHEITSLNQSWKISRRKGIKLLGFFLPRLVSRNSPLRFHICFLKDWYFLIQKKKSCLCILGKSQPPHFHSSLIKVEYLVVMLECFLLFLQTVM